MRLAFLIGILMGGLSGSHAERVGALLPIRKDSLPAFDSSAEVKEKKVPLDALVIKYAKKLLLDPLAINQPAAWTFIDEWFGVRYVWGGNSKKGIDCSALTERLLNEVYQIKSSRMVMGQFEKCRIIDSAELQLGDLIFFKTHNKRKGLTHVAFSVGGRYFFHASSNKGVTFDHLDNSYYRRTYRYSARILPDAAANADSSLVRLH